MEQFLNNNAVLNLLIVMNNVAKLLKLPSNDSSFA